MQFGVRVLDRHGQSDAGAAPALWPAWPPQPEPEFPRQPQPQLLEDAADSPFGSLQFTQIRWLSDPEVIAGSVVEVKEVSRSVNGAKNAFSLYDAEMGSSSLSAVCPTCSKNGCDGHRGYIQLPEAVYKYCGLDAVVRLLKCVCGGCGMPVFRLRDELSYVDLRAMRDALVVEDVHPSERDVREVLRLSARMDDEWQRFTKLAEICGKRAGAQEGCCWHVPDLSYQDAGTAAGADVDGHPEEALVPCGMPRPQYSRVEGAVIKRKWREEQLSAMSDEERFLVTQPFLPRDAFKILDMIPHCVLKLFGFNPDISHPKWMITWVQPVSPPALRPRSRGRGIDDTTKSLEVIIRSAKDMREVQANLQAVESRVIPLRLRHARARARVTALERIPADQRTPEQNRQLAAAIKERDESQPCLRRALKTLAEKQREYAKDVADMQYEVSSLIKNDLQSHFNKPAKRERYMKQTKEKRDLQKVLGTKRGAFRQELGGRRVMWVLRTVIEASVGHNIGEVGVPEFLCKKLTKPETVNLLNIKDLQARIIRGHGVMNGVKSIKKIDPLTGEEVTIDLFKAPIEERERYAQELAVGWEVKRYLKAGDAIVFNRQPTLHKHSIIAGLVRPTKGYALEIELGPLEQQNGDFDGDEENGHILQNIPADAEAKLLLYVPEQMGNERTCLPIVGLVQDSRSGAYLLTRRDVFMDEAHVMQTLMQLHFRPKLDLETFCEIPMHVTDESYIPHGPMLQDLPPPAILLPRKKREGRRAGPPRRFWTGKQIFSVLLPKLDFTMGSVPSGESLRRSPAADIDESRCVLVRGGELLVGRLRSNVLGSGTRGFVHLIRNYYGNGAAANFVSDAQRLLANGPYKQALSIGLSDCILHDEATKKLVREYIDTTVARFNMRTAGCDPSSLPREAMNELESILTKIGPLLTEALPDGNGLRDTILSGAKGKPTNIAMILGCLGMQNIRGNSVATTKVPCGLTRTLVINPPNATDAESHGFISQSYMDGLTVAAFVFHMMSGREGLVDTAMKTAESGYMQRRLGKAQGHNHLNVFGQVVTGNGMMLSQAYGDDGYDASRLQRLSATWLWDAPEDFLTAAAGSQALSAAARNEILAYFTLLRALFLGTLAEEDRVPETLQVPVDVPEFIANMARGNLDDTPDMMYARRLVKDPEAPASEAFLRAATTAMLLGITRVFLLAPELDEGLVTMSDDIYETLRTMVSIITASRKTQAAAMSPGVGPLKDLLAAAAEDGLLSMTVKRLLSYLTRQDGLLMTRCLYALWLHPAVIKATVAKTRGRVPAEGFGLTRAQTAAMLQMVMMKTIGARAHPGENVGTLSSTCIGEPTTQMVLNTFHMAGVNVQQVTRGMPRILELIDGKNTERSCGSIVAVDTEAQAEALIRSMVGHKWNALVEELVVEPIATAPLSSMTAFTELDVELAALFGDFNDAKTAVDPWLFSDARAVKLSVGGIKADKGAAASTKDLIAAYRPQHQLRLRIRTGVLSLFEIAAVLQYVVGKQAFVTPVVATHDLIVQLVATSEEREEAALEDLKRKLLRMPAAVGLARVTSGQIVSLPRLKRSKQAAEAALARCEDDTHDSSAGIDLGAAVVSENHKAVSFAGSHLPCLLALAPQAWVHTAYSNNVAEVQATLDIEAARVVYMRELFAAMSHENTYVDPRHLDINVLTMCLTGLLLGINRYYMARTGSSMLATAGFEETVGQLGRAATFAAIDELKGHTARIFVGQPIKTGTGMVEVLEDILEDEYDPAAPHDTTVRRIRRPVDLEAMLGSISSTGSMHTTGFDESQYLQRLLKSRGHADAHASILNGSQSGNVALHHGHVLGFVGRVNGQPLMGRAAASYTQQPVIACLQHLGPVLHANTPALVARLVARDEALLQQHQPSQQAQRHEPKRQRVLEKPLAQTQDGPASAVMPWMPQLHRIPTRLEGLVQALESMLHHIQTQLPGNVLGLEVRLGKVLFLPSEEDRDTYSADGTRVMQRHLQFEVSPETDPHAHETGGAVTVERDMCVQHGISAEHFAAIRTRLQSKASPWKLIDTEEPYREETEAFLRMATARLEPESPASSEDDVDMEADGRSMDTAASDATAATNVTGATGVTGTTGATAATGATSATSGRTWSQVSTAATAEDRKHLQAMMRQVNIVPLFQAPEMEKDTTPHRRELIQDVYYTMRDGTGVRSSCEYGTDVNTIRNCRTHVVKTLMAEQAFMVDTGRPGDLHVSIVSENSLPVNRVSICVQPSMVRIKLRESYTLGPWTLHLTEAWQADNILALMESLRQRWEEPIRDVKLELTRPEDLFQSAAFTPLHAAKTLVCLLPFLYGDTKTTKLPRFVTHDD